MNNARSIMQLPGNAFSSGPPLKCVS